MQLQSIRHAAGFTAVATVLALTSHSAMAVGSYGDIAAPGVYFGSGNVNGNWTMDTTSGVELALRAKNRETLLTLDGSSGTYFADLGLCVPCTGAPKAMWNYEFSVNSGGASGLTYRLGLDHDASAAVNYSWVNPETYWGDNAVAPNPYLGFQNSQNVRFGDTPGGILDVNAAGLYTVTLEAWNGNSMVNTVSMDVQVGAVPEPESYALLLAGLVVLSAVARRRSPK